MFNESNKDATQVKCIYIYAFGKRFHMILVWIQAIFFIWKLNTELV